MRRDDEILRNLVSEATRLRADLEVVRQEIERDVADVAARAFPESDLGVRPRAIVGARTGEGFESVEEFDDATMEQRRKLLEAGARALEKIGTHGEQVPLDDDEETGLEAIVRFSLRPAMVVVKGTFSDPPPPWGALEERRKGIERTLRSVGRVQLAGSDRPYGGTGFLVADDVLMTNCHVARQFSKAGSDRSWVFIAGVQASVDFVENPDVDDPVEFSIEEVIGIHDRLDLALLRVTVAGGQAPAPLTLMSEAPDAVEGRQVYVVGYPAPDTGRNDPLVMRQIFGEIYYVKRLQPGAMLDASVGPVIAESPCSHKTLGDDVIYHDASTLGGNSGSAVVDLSTNFVLGLHYAGYYTKYNQAVALWKLNEDPLLTRAGVNFD
jgi:glutamyl endopeptidase